jgi:hypothetical protein
MPNDSKPVHIAEAPHTGRIVAGKERRDREYRRPPARRMVTQALTMDQRDVTNWFLLVCQADRMRLKWRNMHALQVKSAAKGGSGTDLDVERARGAARILSGRGRGPA